MTILILVNNWKQIDKSEYMKNTNNKFYSTNYLFIYLFICLLRLVCLILEYWWDQICNEKICWIMDQNVCKGSVEYERNQDVSYHNLSTSYIRNCIGSLDCTVKF